MNLSEWIYPKAENVYPEREVVPVDKTKKAIEEVKKVIEDYHEYLNGMFGGLIISRNIKLKAFNLDNEFIKIFGDKFVNMVEPKK